MNEDNMKKSSKKKARPLRSEKDTMRPEYDFSKAVRGATAARYAEGTNVVTSLHAGKSAAWRQLEFSPVF
jgi:hypothetical protein